MKKLALGLLVLLAAVITLFLLPSKRDQQAVGPLGRVDLGQPETGELTPGLDPAPPQAASVEREQLQAQDLASTTTDLKGPFLQGRVIFPAGSPRDESLRVQAYASDRDFHWKRYYPSSVDSEEEIASYLNRRGARPVQSVTVNADGGFSLALSSMGPQVWLALDGRFLYLENPIRLNVDEAIAGRIELRLRAHLGGAIAGYMTRASGESLDRATVGLARDFSKGVAASSMFSTAVIQLAQRCPQGGRYEFRAVRPGFWQVAGRDFGSALTIEQGVHVSSGQTRSVDFALIPGATIRGSVRAKNLPVANVSVSAQSRGIGALLHGPWGFMGAHTRSEVDGSFEIKHVSMHAVSVLGFLRGRSTNTAIERPLKAGELLDGVELIFDDLGWISGSVVDHEGRPAGNVELTGSWQDDGSWRRFCVDNLSDSMGRFRIPCGHPKAEQRVDAIQKNPRGRVVARGSQTGLRVGDADVMVALARTCSISGSVHSVGGEPLTGVQVDLSWKHRLAYDVNSETDAEGNFMLEGILPGTWNVSAQLDGWETAGADYVASLEGSAGPLKFVLKPNELTEPQGVVVFPDGSPVSGALVTDDSGGSFSFDNPEQSNFRVSDASGHFQRLMGKNVSAWTPGYAPSLPQTALESGEGMVLRLRQAGSLNAQVYTRQGEAAHDYFIYAHHPEHGYSRAGMTHRNGSAQLLDLAPGRWNAEARPVPGMGYHPSEPKGFNEQYQWGQSQKLSTSFNIVEGETTDVVLGPLRTEQVLVSGVLSLGGAPLQGTLTFVEDGMFEKSRSWVAESDAVGNYSIKLPHPGSYTVLGVCKSAGVGNMQLVDIPGQREAHLSVDLPAGSILVTVAGLDGHPVANVKLGLLRSGGTGTALNSMLFSLYKGTTDSRGQVLLSGVPAGAYRVVGIGLLLRPMDVRVEDSRVEVKLAHEPQGSLLVRLDSIKNHMPESIDLFIRDSSGAWVGHHKVRNFPKEGYEIKVAPGAYSVFACGIALATRENSTVDVRGGQTSLLDLSLAPGTFVSIECKGAQDPNAIRLHLDNAAGLSWEGAVVSEITRSGGTMSLFSHEGLHPERSYLGALPPGEYRVVAHCLKQQAVATFTLDGSAARLELKLTFK